mmetsp:Transcript_3161/g.9870  ORF Transcript_3161/g.9870 Transcript_3161/m.9870 type:complete len:147 (+) Transcript_3161:361-801(+)
MAPEKKYGSVEEGAEDVVPDSKPRDYKVNALRVLAGVAVVCVGLAGAAAARGASKEMELETLPVELSSLQQGIWEAVSSQHCEKKAGDLPHERPDPFGAEKKLEIGTGEGANGPLPPSHHFLNLFYGFKSYTDTLPYRRRRGAHGA